MRKTFIAGVHVPEVAMLRLSTLAWPDSEAPAQRQTTWQDHGQSATLAQPAPDPGGFPFEVHLFEGDTAETTILISVLTAFGAQHQMRDPLVVADADADMLSASNLNALEDASSSFIVVSRISKAPDDLAEPFEHHRNYFTDP